MNHAIQRHGLEDPRLTDAIAKAEQLHGVVAASRCVIRMIGSRSKLAAAVAAGAIVPAGRRGGTGEWTYYVADVIRYMAGAAPATGRSPRTPPAQRDTASQVADALAQVDALGKAGAR